MKNNDLSPLIQFSKAAATRVKKLLADENNPYLKLRIYITGGGCKGFQYKFIFDDKKNDDDFIIEKQIENQNIALVIDSMSLQYMLGSSIDYIENLEGSRFIVNNPNIKGKCGCGFSFDI